MTSRRLKGTGPGHASRYPRAYARRYLPLQAAHFEYRRFRRELGTEISQPYLVRVAGWTEERYFQEAPETRFVEFEDGEVIVHSPVGTRHQRLAAFLSMLHRGDIRSRHLGEVLNGPAVVRLRPGLNYEPDIFFIPRDRLDHVAEEYFFQHLLSSEPLGPYLVREHALGRLETQEIPGFWLDVSWLWQDPLPDELGCLSQILNPR